jgi:hypothetical protein
MLHGTKYAAWHKVCGMAQSMLHGTKYAAWHKAFGRGQRRLLPVTSPSVYVVLTNALPCKIMRVTPGDIVCIREKSGPPLSILLVVPRSHYNAKVTLESKEIRG